MSSTKRKQEIANRAHELKIRLLTEMASFFDEKKTGKVCFDWPIGFVAIAEALGDFAAMAEHYQPDGGTAKENIKVVREIADIQAKHRKENSVFPEAYTQH